MAEISDATDALDGTVQVIAKDIQKGYRMLHGDGWFNVLSVGSSKKMSKLTWLIELSGDRKIWTTEDKIFNVKIPKG